MKNAIEAKFDVVLSLPLRDTSWLESPAVHISLSLMTGSILMRFVCRRQVLDAGKPGNFSEITPTGCIHAKCASLFSIMTTTDLVRSRLDSFGRTSPVREFSMPFGSLKFADAI